ncbi:hypothetical protein OIU77_024588 [Salix suchowensis]|uniref:PHD-type domain-containing protein n=1 Tax=Salix suchowensis TaxID=1278906 RepID=A0ABQ9BTW3_9ROSI|nr:hypothetical protein OIU77_024588 [Salix suchowensis]
MLEAEAKDSEDEVEGTSVKQPSCENVNKSPQNLKAGTSKVPGHLDAGGVKGASSNDPPDPLERTPISTRTGNTIGSPKVLLGESIKSSAKVLNPSVTNSDQGSEPTHLVDGPSRINNHSPLGNTGHSVHDMSSMNAELNSHTNSSTRTNSSTAKLSKFRRNTFTEDNVFLTNMGSETGENENANKKTPQPSSRDLRENNLVCRFDSGGFVVERSGQMVAEAEEPQNQQQDGGGPFSLKKELEIDKSDMLSDLHVLQAEKDDLITKPARKKMIAKKTLRSRANLKIAMAEVKDREEDGNSTDATELETSPATVNVAEAEKMETESATRLADNIEDKIDFMDDETEAPEDKNECENFLQKEQADMIDLPQKEDEKIDMKLEADNSAAYMRNSPVEGKNSVEIQKRNESPLTEDFVKGKGRKQPSGKTNTKTVASVVRKEESNKVLNLDGNLNSKNIEDNAAERESTEPCRAGQGKSRIISRKKSRNSVEDEKENRPVIDGDQYASLDDERVGETACKSNKAPLKLNQKATHYIAPGPIRRTEKFFAAAASGRWILKTDYLTACSQAGRFLEEESYEWHKNGLSEDGAINLEAPRKWRLLRERTGHGAFYGMRIIIYGECMTPPLDTLKRVVKAGDDKWVQEFLKHKIPCIVSDYLVEYVCKPGNSLERHVLYNTNDLAEKSFSNLLSKGKEIVEDLTTLKDCGSGDDIACEVCCSCDRGEVMLICGDASGSVGCGAGTHIDCCDPPLESIPEDNWFCPNCSGGRSTSPKKKRIKKALH